jgi:hypothetical protein
MALYFWKSWFNAWAWRDIHFLLQSHSLVIRLICGSKVSQPYFRFLKYIHIYLLVCRIIMMFHCKMISKCIRKQIEYYQWWIMICLLSWIIFTCKYLQWTLHGTLLRLWYFLEEKWQPMKWYFRCNSCSWEHGLCALLAFPNIPINGQDKGQYQYYEPALVTGATDISPDSPS